MDLRKNLGRVLICACWVGLLCGDDGSRVEYAGGTVAMLRGTGKVQTTDERVLRFLFGRQRLEIPYHKINLIEYGQNASRRIAMAVLISPAFLLSKKRQHYLTVGFEDGNNRQQAVVVKVDKGAIRALLASLEARTGLKVQYQDEEARKGVRGG